MRKLDVKQVETLLMIHGMTKERKGGYAARWKIEKLLPWTERVKTYTINALIRKKLINKLGGRLTPTRTGTIYVNTRLKEK